jgi:hypothetical protein
VLDAFFGILEQVRAWIENKVSVQVDPLASLIATFALIIAVRAERRSAKMLAEERSRAGNISKVAIHEHSMQAVFDHRSPQTSPRDAGQGEGFVCSVYSGDTEVEVEGIYLKIVFIEGLLARRRWEIRVDIQASEGLALPATSLPFRMKQNSRLDWTFPTFVTFFPNGRGEERRVDVTRVMSPSEQLCFEFGAYSRASSVPIKARTWHRLGFLGVPLRGAPWTKVIKYPSLWAALTSATCPASLRGWFLEWLECREDFEDRIANDPSGELRNLFHQIVVWRYWPAGHLTIGGVRTGFGDPEHDSRKHRIMGTLLGLGDMSPIDRGHAVSGRGGSGEASQLRMFLALSLLAGKITSSELLVERFEWPPGLTSDDDVLKSAVAARRLGDIKNRQRLTQRESDELAQHLSTVRLELEKCTYMPPADCEEAVSQALEGSLPG